MMMSSGNRQHACCGIEKKRMVVVVMVTTDITFLYQQDGPGSNHLHLPCIPEIPEIEASPPKIDKAGFEWRRVT